MKPILLITGANGMLAKKLAATLKKSYSIRFLTRNVKNKNEFYWDISKYEIDDRALDSVDYIIHLAGAPIAGKRWTAERKSEIIESRVDSAILILTTLVKKKITIKAFISASATGYYGAKTSHEIMNEKSDIGNDFLSEVCDKWENSCHAFYSHGLAKRIVIVRSGVVLEKSDGALAKMSLPIKYGVGAALGSGKQFMPWIHIDDLCAVYASILDNEKMVGIYNAVSPLHVNNVDLTRKIAKRMHRKIFMPNIPKFIMKIMLGEMAVMLLEGSRVSSAKLLESGFKFNYENIDLALDDIFKQ